MRRETAGVLGIFDQVTTLTHAVRELQAAGFTDFVVHSPVPCHEIEEALATRESPVRIFTLFAGILGGATGLILSMAASDHYPLITGGKPILSIPPFLIIAFELAILFGALGTILGMAATSRLPRLTVEPSYDPQFSVDRFGVWVPCTTDQRDAVQVILRAVGVEEVRCE